MIGSVKISATGFAEGTLSSEKDCVTHHARPYFKTH